MASPYSTGGGGTHFEARVVAYYLVAILGEKPARGLSGLYARQALTQRAAFDEPLDDIIVTGLLSNGANPRLHLQIKTDITYTESDDKWVSVLHQAWDTFQGTFDSEIDRLGVAVSVYSANADKHYQTVLKWAQQSISGEHFVERIMKENFSHEKKRNFVKSVRTILDSYAAEPISNDLLWQFLRCFVILHFDFSLEDSSRDLIGVRALLSDFLPPDQRQQAGALWDYLVANNGELIPSGGGATRDTLVRQLQSKGMPTGIATSFWKDIQVINSESMRALSDIKSDIHGLQLHRHEVYEQVKKALDEGRFIQIDGEPGTGKSALLKDVAEEFSRAGPIFVLKDGRIQPRGWSAHAHILSVSPDATALLREIGTAGESLLFIDGIDKISDPAIQLTINDLVKVIAEDPVLSGWKILVTVREQNLEHIATWLDPEAMKRFPIRNVTVPLLERLELALISEHFTRLRPLLLESGSSDVILQRPFFLESILSLAGSEGTAELPATEIELLKLWWKRGGSESADFSQSQHRRNTLINLAERFVRASNVAISIRELDPESLDDLRSAGVLRDKDLGHTVEFAHDIYEEWALSELLISKQPEIVAFLHDTGEPQVLERPMQLLGSYVLETNTTELEWKTLYERVSDTSLRPVWQRAILTSCIHSTRTELLLDKLKDYLKGNDYEHLKKLLVALQTIEVVPNLVFLDEKFFPDLNPDKRVELAHHAALPKPLTWIRFLDWFMAQVGSPWPDLIPDLLPVFDTWQSAWSGQQIRHCEAIGEIASCWLVEFETARHPIRLEDLRKPFGIDIDCRKENEIENSIRSLFLSSVSDIPELVSAYLKDHCSRKRRHMFRDEIMIKSNVLAKHVPTDLVDFILDAYFEFPSDAKDEWGNYSNLLEENLGVAGHLSFYPASPAQPPFLALLRENEAEGLRLVRSLCNHSIYIWQWTQKNRGWHHEPITPIAIELEFPWGTQRFWGDGRVYLWFRGYWGNSAVGSALMALEQWALEQIEGGRLFKDLFRTVVEGNDSVASLGLALSLCIAHKEKSIECSLPFVTCSYLWKWDLKRLVQDTTGTPSNEIGNWHDSYQLNAVHVLNTRHHRQQDIRVLLPYFVFHSDKEIKKRYTKAIQHIEEYLPFEFEEQKKDPEFVEALQERMKFFAEQADPKNWKVETTEDGKYLIWNEPPFLKDEKNVRERKEFMQLNQCMALSTWAEKSLETDALDVQFPIEEGILAAKAQDELDLFDHSPKPNSLLRKQRKAAVAGAAFVAARFYHGDRWDDDVGPWCFDVLKRSVTAQGTFDDHVIRSSVLLMHPVVFAVYGYAALLNRNYEIRSCQEGLLNLAVHAAEGVVNAVAASSDQYAKNYPQFYWVLFNLMVQQCIVKDGEIPSYFSMVWDEKESVFKKALLCAVVRYLDTGEQPVLPDIPLPWIKRTGSDLHMPSETRGYERNNSIFLWNLAEKAIFDMNFDVILSNTEWRRQFVRFVGQLVALTIQEIIPPWAKSRRDTRTNTPFEWVSAMFDWCGRISAQLSPDEVRYKILQPIFSIDNETALLAMENFVPSFMINALLPPAACNDEQLVLWEEITTWIFDNKEGKSARADFISREFGRCALATLFCVHGGISSLVCGLEEGWPHMSRVETMLKRAVCQFGKNSMFYHAVSLFFRKGGFDLLPDPGIKWLKEIVVSKKQDKEFWRSNGDDTVKILEIILERKDSLLNTAHRETLSLISDILVDNGVRGARFLQQNSSQNRKTFRKE